MRIRHKGLRALHEKDDPALHCCPLIWCRVFGGSWFASRMRLAPAMPMPLVSGYTL